jgi:nicotinamidase-related amidase
VTALIIIDMQNGYFADDQSRQALDRLVPAINKIVKNFEQKSITIIHAITQHAPDKSTWTKKMLIQDRGFCITGSREAEEVSSLAGSDRHIVVPKTRDNAFLFTNLDEILQQQNIKNLVLVGVSTHECVAATGLEAVQRDYEVTIVMDGVYSPAGHRASCMVELLQQEYGVHLVTLSQLLEE